MKMFNLLIDTCVWLDLAKDHQQETLITIIEELIEKQELSLIVPRTIITEFERNKEKVIKESNQSVISAIKRAKDAIHKFSDSKNKTTTLTKLSDLTYKIPLLRSTAEGSLERIEKLLKNKSSIIETSENVKLRAAQRAIDGLAPFHKFKNSINDAILLETYIDCVHQKSAANIRFSFVTHNKNDFSEPRGNNKKPHPDISEYFSRVKSLYFISLAEALHRIKPELVTDIMIEHEWELVPRSLKEILDVEVELESKIWYNRHQIRCEKIQRGKIKIINAKDFNVSKTQTTITKTIWNGAMRSAKEIEKKYRIGNLGPWDDFEWGMLNGKLSALRWAIGEDWDSLYT